MKSFTTQWCLGIMLALSLFCLALTVPASVRAQSTPVDAKRFQGSFNLTTSPPTFTFAGVAPEMGSFDGLGEAVFRAGEQPGTQVVSGPVVLRGSHGEILVGNVSGNVTESGRSQPVGATLQFHWSDSVRLSDGTVVTNTGRFLNRRPAGIVVETNDPKTPQTNIIVRILITILRG